MDTCLNNVYAGPEDITIHACLRFSANKENITPPNCRDLPGKVGIEFLHVLSSSYWDSFPDGVVSFYEKKGINWTWQDAFMIHPIKFGEAPVTMWDLGRQFLFK
ncbi:uncharacterized protein VTP21DRAFT_2005 [Calcarisporiella thermophila]|uniref:uncharacterized protein n=1 Tax=Calcarisporiella thermophila TaxID=911321 RepID=UPI0037445C3E